jgi:hypothetical protein
MVAVIRANLVVSEVTALGMQVSGWKVRTCPPVGFPSASHEKSSLSAHSGLDLVCERVHGGTPDG